MKQEFIDETLTGCLGIAQKSGLMTPAVFYKWLMHFQMHVEASLDDKVLLLVDGHISHKDYLIEPAETTNIPMQPDSTPAKNLARPSQVAESSSTSMITASTSAADNPRPLSAAQSRDIVTAIPTTPTTSKMILQDMNINVPISVVSPVSKGIYVAGQEAKAKSASPLVPKKNTRKVTKALDFSYDSENDLSSFLETGDDDEVCPCIYCSNHYSGPNQKMSG
ncbi:hypothetical protein WA026_015747 [Henosepilachna vigintioctopunctata]|uniref:DDE-1 domain-containing protein n=1 Tax=Henosepilachna vigintioctopunctata TaxID=420089 RepID=A0AAW1UYQ2_9CUCU